MGYNNYDNNEDLYSLLKNTGFRGLKDRIFNRSLDVVTSHLKNHFGIEFSLDPTYVKRFTKWVSENDPKFKEHIANPYVLNNPLDSSDPELVGTFVIKMDKATYVRVNAHSDSRMNNNRTFITVFIFGKKTYKVYKQLCKYMFEANDDNNVLYTITAKEKGSWLCLGSTLICRPMDTLFFDTGIKEQIINHVNTWIEGQPLYQNRGLIYKTGILLYGKAGTGKSSLATAIATYLKCPLITIDTATFSNLNISEVVDAINADETRFVVLIDEIDTIFKSRDDEDMSETQKENTAKLLALLDSQQSPSNVVFVATTNYYDRLDKALTRKGRFDLMIKLDDMHRDAAINMCKSFELNDSQVNHVLDDMFKDCDTVNPANLQARILEELKP